MRPSQRPSLRFLTSPSPSGRFLASAFHLFSQHNHIPQHFRNIQRKSLCFRKRMVGGGIWRRIFSLIHGRFRRLRHRIAASIPQIRHRKIIVSGSAGKPCAVGVAVRCEPRPEPVYGTASFTCLIFDPNLLAPVCGRARRAFFGSSLALWLFRAYASAARRSAGALPPPGGSCRAACRCASRRAW